MWKLIYTILLLSLLFINSISQQQQLSSKECEDLGFTGLALCSDCNSLAEYVKDQGPFSTNLFLHSFNSFNFNFDLIDLILCF